MEKLEKCYYVIIKNKKRGKFSGAGPIQVAKKVASKKLKSGKDMEFYLDEVAGKKKRYGPYQVRKDKNSGKVVVIKDGKIMKGGLLSINDRQRLRSMFILFNRKLSDNPNPEYSKINELNLFNLGRQIAYFLPIIDRVKYYYKFAVFNEINGNIYIMIYIDENNVEIVNFVDFFLNPEYSIHFKIVGNSTYEIVRNDILYRLKNLEIIESRIIIPAVNYILDLIENKNCIIMYYPDYSRPLIRKCVYPDLTFGILDEETPVRILQNKMQFPTPKSHYQRFLILTNTGISGMSVNEPIIYVRQSVLQLQQQQLQLELQLQQLQLQLQQQLQQQQQLQLQQQQPLQYEQHIKQIRFQEQLQFQQLQLQQLKQQQQQLQLQQQQPLHFDYCIYSLGYNQLKIMSYDNVNNDFTLYNRDLISIKKEIFFNLVDIPEKFGRFKRIKDISRMRIRQETPVIRQETPVIRQTIPANIQQTPVIRQKSSINKLERKIERLFNQATIKNFKINEKLLTNSIKPIRQRLENLKLQIGTLTEQQLERQIKNIYVNTGKKIEYVLRQSQLQQQ